MKISFNIVISCKGKSLKCPLPQTSPHQYSSIMWFSHFCQYLIHFSVHLVLLHRNVCC